jgi:YihY family inner membrane protein
MHLISRPAQHLLSHPFSFFWQAVRGFGKNQGLMLAGAVAYYALLSLVPLLILSTAALSHLVDTAELLSALGRYLEWLVPSQSKALLADIAGFIDNQVAIGAVLLVTMLFFSSLAFSILEKAMLAIFAHRHAGGTRHALVSAILPYCFVLLLGVSLLAITIASVVFQAIGRESIHFLGLDWSLRGVAGLLLYALGIGTEVAILTVTYLVLPVGRTRLTHAVLGAVTVTAIWDAIRHGLVWYFATLSQASVVYGSLTTAVLALLSMEIAATLLLFGAQVIAEYEQLDARLEPASPGSLLAR